MSQHVPRNGVIWGLEFKDFTGVNCRGVFIPRLDGGIEPIEPQPKGP